MIDEEKAFASWIVGTLTVALLSVLLACFYASWLVGLGTWITYGVWVVWFLNRGYAGFLGGGTDGR